tara:strand:- start:126 stop:239 length:114 start_codon:yes stop_codon:yes gene_type:complete
MNNFPTEGQALFLTIAIAVSVTLFINFIVYLFVGNLT